MFAGRSTGLGGRVEYFDGSYEERKIEPNFVEQFNSKNERD